MAERDRREYFRQRRAKLAAERAALEEAGHVPTGKALTETVLVRVSGDMLAAIDARRTHGLFNLSRSEWIRNTLAEKLGSQSSQ